MREAKNNGDGSRRYKKVKSYFETAVKFNLRRKGTTLASSPKLPSNRAYHRSYSRRARG